MDYNHEAGRRWEEMPRLTFPVPELPNKSLIPRAGPCRAGERPALWQDVPPQPQGLASCLHGAGGQRNVPPVLHPSSTPRTSLQLMEAGDSINIERCARRTQKGEKWVFYTAKKVFQHKGEETM